MKSIWIGLLTVTLSLSAMPAIAITVQDVPNPRRTNGGWVTDMANVLTPQTEVELNRLITNLEAQNSSEIAVVTVPETAPAPSPKAFATELFNTWRIGKAFKNNGVLFLVSVRDRRVEVETGSGLDAVLPPDRIDEILQADVIPRFRQQDFDGGTLAGTRAIASVLSFRLSPTLSVQWSPTMTKMLLLFTAIFTGSCIMGFRRRQNNRYRSGSNSHYTNQQYRSQNNSYPNSSTSSSSYSSSDYSSGSNDSSYSSSDSSSGSSSSDYSSGSSSSDSSSGSGFGGGSSDGGGSGSNW